MGICAHQTSCSEKFPPTSAWGTIAWRLLLGAGRTLAAFHRFSGAAACSPGWGSHADWSIFNLEKMPVAAELACIDWKVVGQRTWHVNLTDR